MKRGAGHGEKEVSRAEEAKNLAKDAVEATRQGDAEEGKLLANATKALDKDAAGEVLAGESLPKSDVP